VTEPRPWRWWAVDGDRLETWDRDDLARPGHALRIDARMVTGGHELTWVSLALAPPGISLPCDDPLVSHALRRRLERPWPGAASTLLVDWSRIAGAVAAAPTPEALDDDPFATVFPVRGFRVEPGLLARVPAPVGPGITRYGSGNPWPFDRYAGQVE
jgi:hypothetical protein